MTPERLWCQRQGHRRLVGDRSVGVRLPGLWDLALLSLGDSTSLLCNMLPKVVRSKGVLNLWQLSDQGAQTLHNNNEAMLLFSPGARTPATVLYWLVSCSRRPVCLLGQAVSGWLAHDRLPISMYSCSMDVQGSVIPGYRREDWWRSRAKRK